MSAPAQLFQLLLSSEVKGDLLTLFHKNPGLMDTIEGVARRIGRVGKAIDADVRDMIQAGVLATRQVGSREVILLDKAKDKAAQESIAEYLKNLEPVHGD